MSEITAPGSGEAAARATEEAAFYHEAALNAAWTGSRLAIGALSFLFGAFAFAYFYLFSSNGHGMWLPSSTRIPSRPLRRGDHGPDRGQRDHPDRRPAADQGAAARAPWFVDGGSSRWSSAWRRWRCRSCELLDLPFQPGQSGFASVFVGFYPVALVTWLAAMIWLEILVVRSHGASRPSPSWSSRPPTRETYEVQRFQSSLSAFTVVWNYLAIVTFIFWLLFYVR